ncbi:MAG: dihydroorotate dehydrogenase-like protein [bacterium]|jgi:dihydroorotate dehydrogenase (fumarate)|nr:dihydroorotate dehydrogenase-like protein [candidate division KSB1 bacterium]MDH7559772.1 dihydroorotate dehydrogenase-like protein [bacterium]
MADLSTKYMGMELANPFIVASCRLTATLDGIQKCADAGAGAVVLKSLFEEQIDVDTSELEVQTWLTGHAEAFEYVRAMGMAMGPREYVALIEQAKKKVTIPIIASLNCVDGRWWREWARQIALAGADGLELNIALMPSDVRRTAADIERHVYAIVEQVREHVSLPLAVKIGPYFTSIPHVAQELARRGAAALVLFNRFYQMDIDAEKLTVVAGNRLSSPDELHLPLRWIAVLAGRVNADLAAATGVHDGKGAVKAILAGATAVQLCSTLYKNGLAQIRRIDEQVTKWLDERGHKTAADIRGLLCQEKSERPEVYERLQYIKALTGIE